MSVKRAQVVSRWDDPYVLVTVTDKTLEWDLVASATRAWRDEFGLTTQDDTPQFRVGECRLYRWVPDPYGGDGDYAYWLREAAQPGPGAFWAVEVHPRHASSERAA